MERQKSPPPSPKLKTRSIIAKTYLEKTLLDRPINNAFFSVPHSRRTYPLPRSRSRSLPPQEPRPLLPLIGIRSPLKNEWFSLKNEVNEQQREGREMPRLPSDRQTDRGFGIRIRLDDISAYMA